MRTSRRFVWQLFGVLAAQCIGVLALAQTPAAVEPVLGAGDIVHITVYQNPDLTVEARLSDAGQINMPLIGNVALGGLTVPGAQSKIEKLLRDGGFVNAPQVTIQTMQIRSNQISILGQVTTGPLSDRDRRQQGVGDDRRRRWRASGRCRRR